MLTTLTLALALCGQQAPRNEIADLMPPARTTQAQRIAARRAALRRQNQVREYREAQAQAAAEAAAAKQFREELPYRLELQRQMLQRQSDIERNQALHRMARAAEMEAANQQYLLWQLRGR